MRSNLGRVSRLAVLIAALLVAITSRSNAVVLLPTGFNDQAVVSTGLAEPTSFAFLPDGRVLVSEQRTGGIRLIANNLLVPGAIGTVASNSSAANERGLLSIAVDPGWPARPYVYVHHSQTGSVLRVVRFTATGTLTDPTSTNLSLGSQYTVIGSLRDVASNHNGGALRFGTDNMLYLSLGDDASACMAQDSTRLLGVVLRLDVGQLPTGAGGPPSRALITPIDNPFVALPDTNARLVHSYGFRNPFRFQIDRESGNLYVSDVGEGTWEEISEIKSGDNAGWPHREGPVVLGNIGCPEPGGSGTGDYVPPIDSYDHGDGVVIIAAGMYRSALHSPAWPAAWNGNVFYADYYNGFMRMLHKTGSNWARTPAAGQPDPQFWALGLTNPVDFQWGPDGHLWWLGQFGSGGGSTSGSLHRIVATAAVAVSPTPVAARLSLAAAPNPTRGDVTLTFSLPQAGNARLWVHDLAGRRVAVLFEGARSAGSERVTWNGRDANGSAVPAGLYFARLEMGDERVSTRVMRVK
ncbi:MAG: T9SS type A sorting domain-containing protein [Candidatus Eisenbacteria bacterium]|uniref:T9SS type A sorting domain-containing protein n=1 Tax=Eiseniibacteriota bacterium TaxID=2212470 RepID=A0A849SHB5_UNCEI|nr:T9SS type A sorting domain-containing protein [Candidatus Eisenbacteria bacterium]